MAYARPIYDDGQDDYKIVMRKLSYESELSCKISTRVYRIQFPTNKHIFGKLNKFLK